jgi:hypothetical protein
MKPGGSSARVALADAFLIATGDMPPEEVGAILGVSAATVLRWRRYGVKSPRLEARQRMAAFLNGTSERENVR